MHRQKPMGRREGQRPSKLRRVGEVAKVLASYGIDYLSPHPGRKKSHHKEPEEQRLREVLEQLGPTYIKLGQAASTRPDIVPPRYAHELAKLQDNAPEVPYADIMQVMREEFGCSPDMIYGEFEKEPRAAASIAQVHNAVLGDGTQVAVKIQRPDIRPKIEADLLVMHDIVDFLNNNFEEMRNHDLEGWFEEFEFSLRNELDFTYEGDNMERFRKNFEEDPAVYIPRVFWDYATSRVLTMERLDGIKVSHAEELRAEGIDPKEIARTCARVVLKMVYDDGFFHADPHAGNFFILPDGRIGLMDMGMVGFLDRELKDSLLRIALSVSQSDAERLTDEIIAFAESEDVVDRSRLERDISRLLQKNRGGHRKISMAQMLNEVLDISAKHGLILPGTIALLARTFTMAEGLGEKLDPDFDLTAFAEPYLRELYEKRYSPLELARLMKEDGPMLADLLIRFPRRAEKIFSRLEKGDFTVVSRIYEQDKILNHIHMAAHRIAMSMLAAGLIAGISIVAIAYRPKEVHGWGAFLMAFFAIVIAGIAYSLFRTIWRSGRDL